MDAVALSWASCAAFAAASAASLAFLAASSDAFPASSVALLAKEFAFSNDAIAELAILLIIWPPHSF